MATGSLAKGLNLLAQLAEDRRDWGLTELANSLGLDKSSAYRLLDTMVSMSFVEKDAQSKRYRVGPKLCTLFPPSYNHIKQAAQSTLRSLSKSLGVTVALRVQEGNQMVVIDRVESEDLLRVSFPIGYRHPITFGCSGKVFLAFLPHDEAIRLVESCDTGGKVGLGARSIPDGSGANDEQTRSQLTRTRERGYEVGREVVARGTRSVSIPLFAKGDRPVAVLSLTWPSVKYPRAMLSTIVKKGLEAANQISRNLPGNADEEDEKADIELEYDVVNGASG